MCEEKGKRLGFKSPPPWPSLTDLPDHVVDDILVRLPLREAVRTSVLSRAWRHRWQSIPELLLEDLPAAAIDKVLLLHSAPVRRFSLATSHTAHADRWILSLSRRGAGHLLSLDLSFDCQPPLYRPLHPLHPSVFSLRGTLTHLRLADCSLSLPPPHPPCCSFPALRSLRLESVEFPDDRQLSVLISGCPALQHLSLLDVRRCGSLRVPSPSLRSLELYSDCDRVELTSGQALHNLIIHLYREHTDVELAQLFRGVVCEDQLCLQGCTMKALAKGSIPESTVTGFQRLRSLSMSVSLVDPSQISVMLCLMRSAPNLQKLILMGRKYANDATGPGEDFWIGIQSLELFASLRTVDMIANMIHEPDIEFMQFILARAQVLETLTISPTVTTRHHESALTELRKFHRTSTRAQIIYEEQEADETED